MHTRSHRKRMGRRTRRRGAGEAIGQAAVAAREKRLARANYDPFAKKSEDNVNTVNPLIEREITREEDRLRREKGNHAAWEFGHAERSKIGYGRRAKRSRRPTRRRGGAECDDRWDEEKEDCLKAVAAREEAQRKALKPQGAELEEARKKREELKAKGFGGRKTRRLRRRH